MTGSPAGAMIRASWRTRCVPVLAYISSTTTRTHCKKWWNLPGDRVQWAKMLREFQGTQNARQMHPPGLAKLVAAFPVQHVLETLLAIFVFGVRGHML